MRDTSRNIPLFIAFRVLFNARFYYPVLGVLFVDLGLSLAQYAALNAIWAAAIVTLEIPSGALADTIGRRRMVVLAAVLMVAEMAVFAFAPTGDPQLLFWLLALNRLLSGAAEASASGADEALAYDSLPARDREAAWPKVLASLVRWQSGAFFVAMLAGAALFDRSFLEGITSFFGLDLPSGPATRWPVFATLATAFACLGVALSMRETGSRAVGEHAVSVVLRNIARGAGAVATDRRIAILLVAALACDAFARLFVTFASNFNRLIGIPEAAFGLVGSALGLLGFVAAPAGKWLVGNRGAVFNFCLLGLLIFGGLTFAATALPLWGVMAMLPIGLSMSLLGFFVSHYLNAWTQSDLRATVLSFRGLAFNLGYGAAGLGFAALTTNLRQATPAASEDALFGQSLLWLPPAFLTGALIVAVFAGWRTRLKP